VGGLRVTTLQRTVVDSLTMLPADWGLAVADSALRRVTRADRRDPDRARRAAEPYQAEWLGHLEAAGPRRGRPRARAVLAVADPLAESAGESRTRAMLLAAGLPVPQLQIPVVAEGTTFYADLGWEIGSGRYLLVEFDGLTKYALDGERGADLSRRLAAEKLREDAIRRLGHQLERAVHADLSLRPAPRAAGCAGRSQAPCGRVEPGHTAAGPADRADRAPGMVIRADPVRRTRVPRLPWALAGGLGARGWG
jgi:hypothetical protein